MFTIRKTDTCLRPVGPGKCLVKAVVLPCGGVKTGFKDRVGTILLLPAYLESNLDNTKKGYAFLIAICTRKKQRKEPLTFV